MKETILCTCFSLVSLSLALPQIARAQKPVGEGAVPVGEGAVPVGEGAVPVGEGAVPVGEGAVPVGEGAVPVGEGAVPVGEEAVPVGEDAVPVGEGAVPVGEGTVPVGEGTVPVGEGAVPVGESAEPVGEGAVPVGEGTVSVGEGAHYTNLDNARFAALQKSMNDPATAHLYQGDGDARYAGLKKRLVAALQKPLADQAAVAAQTKRDRAWGDSARAAVGAKSASLFNQAWWAANKGSFSTQPNFYFPQQPATSWRKSTDWKTLAATLKLNPTPYYWDYGRNITFKSDVVYVNNQPIAGHRDAVGSARRLAGTPPAAQGSANQWIPLGTFLFSQNPTSNKVEIAMQFVCGTDGTISGIYYDWNTKHLEPIEGRVALDTQRVAFKIKTSRIVMECGLANLTRGEARVWAHLPDGRSPVWLLARVPN